jgi:hypothetical protein
MDVYGLRTLVFSALSAKLANREKRDEVSLQVTVSFKKSESCSGKTQEDLNVKNRG